MKRTFFASIATVALLGFASQAVACASCGCATGTKDKAAASGDIVDTAVAAGQFNTLVAAVQAADLVDTLKSEGPFTVMAPTDEAFAKLPAGTVEDLLKPENKDQLVAILTYHVIPAKVKAADALKAGEAETVQGGTLTFTSSGDKAMVNGANIVKTDIKTSNGVIHVIDTVLLPE
jgi:uncharacterized surface protein with fasciclin (FAS1) repeats